MLSGEKLRKVAILVDSLDAGRAEALLSQMSSEQQQLIRNYVVELGEVAPSEREHVIESFLAPDATSASPTLSRAPQGEVATSFESSDQKALEAPQARQDLPEVIAENSQGIQQTTPIPSRFAKSMGELNESFDSLQSENSGGSDSNSKLDLGAAIQELNHVEPDRLARLLSLERPLTIAILLAKLEGEQARRIVAELDPELRREVLSRFTRLDETPNDILSELLQSLRQRIVRTEEPLSIKLSSPGIKALERILIAAEPEERGELLESLAAESQQLVEQLIALHGWEANPPMNEPFHSQESDLPSPFADQETTESVAEEILPFPALGRPDDSSADSHPASAAPTRATGTMGYQAPTASDVEKQPGDEEDQEIADHLKEGLNAMQESYQEPLLEFDQLIQLKEKSFLSVLKRASESEVLLALVGADPRLLKKLKRALRRVEVRHLERRLNDIGPMRLRDMQQAQERIVDVALAMMVAGEIENLVEDEMGS